MTTKWLPLLAVCLVAGCRTAPTQSLAEEREQIRQAIEAREAQHARALRERDAELLVRVYTDDAYVITPDEQTLQKKDLEAYFHEYLKLNPTLDTHTLYVDVGTSLQIAYEVGRYEEEYDTPEGRVRAHARYVAVWKKIGGAWRLAAEASVYDTRAPQLVGAAPTQAPDAAAADSALDGAAPFRAPPDMIPDTLPAAR